VTQENKLKGHFEFKRFETQIILQGCGMIHSDSDINLCFLNLKGAYRSFLQLQKEAQTNNKLNQDG
jgi:hypothetical protein